MDINYEALDPKIRRTIQSIESKPHVKYIRYLLTKRFSPASIKKELRNLGLSSSHEQHLTIYYMAVIDPIIKYNGLGYLYSDYKAKLCNKNKSSQFSKDILNYRLHLDSDIDGQVKLCCMIRDLDIEDLWIGEIYKFHGSAATMPVGEDGLRILRATTSFRNHDKILLSEKRYLIDKLILENVPDNRIAKFCKEKLKISVNDYDIASYKRVFFNIKTQNIEERIKSLESEKNSLTTLLGDIKSVTSEFADLTLGETTNLVTRTEKRIEELSDNIKTLNSMYTDYAAKIAQVNNDDFEAMFSDIISRSYDRYKRLDTYMDRDVVDPLFKVAKMMGYAHDKMSDIRLTGKGGSSKTGDIHSKAVVMELYKERFEEVNNEIKARAGSEIGDDSFGQELKADDIEGIDELGMSFEE